MRRTLRGYGRGLSWCALAAAWLLACLLRHPEAALAVAAALFLATDHRRTLTIALAAAAITVARPGLGPAAVLLVLASSLGWVVARRPGWPAVTRAVRGCVTGTAAAVLVAFFAGIVTPPTASLHRYATPRRVYDLTLDPRGHRLAFTTKGASPPGTLDLRTGEIHAIPDLDAAAYERLAWLPASERVVSGGGEGATILDLAAHALERRVVSGSIIDVERVGPRHLAFAEEGSETLHLVDVETGRHEIRAVPHGPYALEYDPAADALFVTSWLDQPKVARLGLADGSFRAVFNGWGSTDVCVFPARGEVAIARPAYGDITILDSVTLAPRRVLPADALVREIECDPARGVIYAASYFDGRIEALDVERGDVFDVVRVGPFARALRLDPATSTVFAGSNAGVFELPTELDHHGEVRFVRGGPRGRPDAPPRST
ncbi:MAG: hypothetical protein IPK07_24250 [Deltaproteobacteria bacterium]|nr:hypothetical protein [Deltaproteobacteria bacterium]